MFCDTSFRLSTSRLNKLQSVNARNQRPFENYSIYPVALCLTFGYNILTPQRLLQPPRSGEKKKVSTDIAQKDNVCHTAVTSKHRITRGQIPKSFTKLSGSISRSIASSLLLIFLLSFFRESCLDNPCNAFLGIYSVYPRLEKSKRSIFKVPVRGVGEKCTRSLPFSTTFEGRDGW
jgi:hypothetical protein